MTATYLADKYGDDGVLNSDGLLNACPDILRCQVMEHIVSPIPVVGPPSASHQVCKYECAI